MNDLQLIQWEDPPPAGRPSTAPRVVEAGAAARTPMRLTATTRPSRTPRAPCAQRDTGARRAETIGARERLRALTGELGTPYDTPRQDYGRITTKERTPMHANSSVTSLVDVLASLRERVMGVSESVLSTGDGLLVAADADAVQPEAISALAAATLGLGTRMAQQADAGSLRDVVIRCGGGQIVVLAVGERALLSVLGDEGLDVAALQRETPAIVEELVGLLSGDESS